MLNYLVVSGRVAIRVSIVLKNVKLSILVTFTIIIYEINPFAAKTV